MTIEASIELNSVHISFIFIQRFSARLSDIHKPMFFKKNVEKMIDMSKSCSVCMVSDRLLKLSLTYAPIHMNHDNRCCLDYSFLLSMILISA